MTEQCFRLNTEYGTLKTLLLIVGPTGVGKTELSLRVAEHYHCPILNCDSRQVYRDIPIGTAAPTPEELTRAQHWFVGTRALEEDYNAGQYERDALALMEQRHVTDKVIYIEDNEVAVLTAGSVNSRMWGSEGVAMAQIRSTLLLTNRWAMFCRFDWSACAFWRS